MAIKNCSVTVNEKCGMAMEQIQIWVKTLDIHKDGKTTKDKLSNVVRDNGGWFASWKGKEGV
ncbi:hypothetical protein SADUNF_Sadunf06G0091400 [Salix dunnii]|uniref:EF-hand domain-containing protein n=1 Tax=Salix dunnii TaxID=1413687 RepID=A0A835MV84_9ROSI|nr:hypothetical protein SADUNF_Sadunf06G0091400 [Salix dunnii]